MQFTSGMEGCCLKLLKEQSWPPENGRIFANVQHFDGIAFFQYANKSLLFIFLLVAECDLSLAVVSGRNLTSPCVTVISHRIVIRFRGAFLGVGVGKAKNYQNRGEKKPIHLCLLSDED